MTSIEIYKSDNMSIIAGRGECINGIVQYIRLHISILVNGKIKNIFQQYIVINTDTETSVSSEPYKLEQYDSFNALCEILNYLGYETVGFYGKLDKAIKKLFKD